LRELGKKSLRNIIFTGYSCKNIIRAFGPRGIGLLIFLSSLLFYKRKRKRKENEIIKMFSEMEFER
jgi:hypothetical protein